MIDGINDDPTHHPFTPGCGDPLHCWACGCAEDEHKPKDPNAFLGAVEGA